MEKVIEKIVQVNLSNLEEYVPEDGYVIRDIKPAQTPGSVFVWLQFGSFIN